MSRPVPAVISPISPTSPPCSQQKEGREHRSRPPLSPYSDELSARSDTVGEESVSHNLACLASRRIVVRSEVRPVPRRYTRLTGYASTRIPAHDTASGKPLDELVERASRWYIL